MIYLLALYSESVSAQRERTNRIEDVVMELNHRLQNARDVLQDKTVSDPIVSVQRILDDRNLLPKFAEWKIEALLHELDRACPNWPNKTSEERVKSLKRRFSFESQYTISTEVNDLLAILNELRDE
jgi:hypothetical protein